MSIPRDVKLKIIQDVYKKWQEIYGDRDDAEAEAANYEMIDIAMAEAEIPYKDQPSKWTNWLSPSVDGLQVGYVRIRALGFSFGSGLSGAHQFLGSN